MPILSTIQEMERECPIKRPLAFSLLQIQERTGIETEELKQRLNELVRSKRLFFYTSTNKKKMFIRDKSKMY